jgi:hypothetical protein
MVCLTAGNDWGEHTYCEEVVLISSGVTLSAKEPGLRIYPNPAQHSLRVEYQGAHLPLELTLYNAMGQEVEQLIMNTAKATWEISSLPAGSYWLRTAEGEVKKVVLGRL